MRRFLRRFAAVGATATAVDVTALLAVRLGLGLPVVVADSIALAAAAAASFGLHRSFSTGDDPHVRLVREPGRFLRVALLAGLVDVAVLRLAVTAVDPDRLGPLTAAKALAVLAAATVRFAAYRSIGFRRVRSDQEDRLARPQPPGERRLSVVVPAYREADAIGAAVAELRAALTGVDHEIVVVDDGSPDATADAARRAGADRVITLTPNQGKGAAVRAGVLAARGRTIAFTDADLAYPPAQLVRLLEEVEAGWDVVVGSRKHVDTTTLVRARRLRELTGRVFNLLTLVVLLGHYRDTQCGLKAFRSDVARLLFSRSRIDRFAFDVEILHLAERYRLSLTEVPVTLSNRPGSSVRVTTDALRMVRDLVRIRLWGSRGAYQLGDEEGRFLEPRK